MGDSVSKAPKSVAAESENKSACGPEESAAERDCEINYHHDGDKCDKQYMDEITESVNMLKSTNNEVLEYLKKNSDSGHLAIYSCLLSNDIQRIENLLKERSSNFWKLKKEIHFIKNEISLINKSIHSPTTGLGEIKEEIRLIEKQVSECKGFCSNVTSGSVIIEDPQSSHVIVIVKNKNVMARTVKVRVLRDDVCPAAVLADKCLMVSGCCSNAITVSLDCASSYEIEVFDLVPGMTVSSIELDRCNRRIKCSRLVPSQFICLVGNCPLACDS